MGYLQELGIVQPTGMGSARISHTEMLAWALLKGIELQPWEVRALRAMSGAFISEQQEAADPNRPPPWSQEAPVEEKTRIAQHIRNVLRD